MKFTMRTILNTVRFRRQGRRQGRTLIVFCILFAVCSSSALWAGGRKSQIETVTAEGGEIWQNDFDVTARKKGLYNYIVYARDRAGNEAISGAFNVKIDPNAGLPTARVVYPENNAVIRQNINLLGVASGRYGVVRVIVRMDDSDYTDVIGTEYWNQPVDFSSIPDGRHTLYVQAFDSKDVAGPVGKVEFILDTSPPEVELSSHNIGDIITGNVILKGAATDPNGIKTIEYSEDGEKFIPLSGKKKGVADLEFALPVNTKKIPDGPLVYYFRAEDMTGVVAVKPYLFFVTNSGPELEVYSPVQGEDVFKTFFLSGRAYDKTGLSRLYYEWGKVTEDIEMRPGDPYWNVALVTEKDSAPTIKVVAVDKVGNINSIVCKLEDRRKVKVPVLVIDYPPENVLKTMQKNMPADTAIYGHIAPGADPLAVLVEGFGEVEALPSFRIAPHMIPLGNKAQILKLTPVDASSVKGATAILRYMKPQSSQKDESKVNIALPEKNSWLSGSSFTLRGNVPSPANMQLEFRLNPQDGWRPLRMDLQGGFNEKIDMPEGPDGPRPQGPVHMELRTVQYGVENYPVYHPFNWAVSQPEITILAPVGERSLVWGNKTVTGVIQHSAPVHSVAYSLNNRDYTDIPFVARLGKTWFTYFCDFNTLGKSKGQLAFRVTDAAGIVSDIIPEYTIEPDPPIPTIIVNSPVDEETITSHFDISGLAYDDVGIHGVYWRILGPKMESISRTGAGEDARRAAVVFATNRNVPFQELLTDQNFRIPIDFSMITDGEYTIEIYAADIYGVHSETISRIIKVSTAPPKTEVLSPVITRYNRKAIMVKGFSTDANDIEEVFFSMDNGSTYQKVNLAADGNWDIALNTADYTDGIYSALVHTFDKYGISAFSNAMINIDNTPPEIFLSEPVDGQHVSTDLRLMGRVSDNLALKSLTYQVISAANPRQRQIINAQPRLVLFDKINLAGLPQGEYIIRIVATDLADNETLISRKFIYDADDKAAEIAIYNPLPGEVHSGPLHIVGIVTGAFQPAEVQLMMNDQPLELVPVDRYGIFRYEIPEEMLIEEGAYKISAYYHSETDKKISSPDHTVYYSIYGPILQVESHGDGDVITGRPWLSGHAWITVPAPSEEDAPLTRSQIAGQKTELRVKRITVSHDNGRTFKTTRGSEKWKVRLETSELPRGPQPVLVKAEFVNGEEAVRRLMVYVDTTIPQVETISPPEDSVHRDNIAVYGTASDNYELANVDLSLRPGDKFFYSVPGAIRGMYFDVKGFGATYVDVGLGLSFFNDNVRFQAQFGITPVDGTDTAFSIGGRYVGSVYGIKLLANIFYLPFAWLFGLDWAFYSMNFALGANFSYFTMDDYRSPLFMGAVVAQWDIANINMQYFYPTWKYFRNYALYLEPELWFASSDIKAGIIFRMTVGMRLNWF
ncbi:MAG: hypothetical protein LBB89_08250 [Treponema sp.]|jgi:hypothetical protein|nr:hypothetical protein [Treponema sp.]